MLTTDNGGCMKLLFSVPFGGDSRLISEPDGISKQLFAIIDCEKGG
jgi:hypothetical protein